MLCSPFSSLYGKSECLNVYRLEDRITVYPADVVLFEGILVFYPQKVRSMFHMKLFVDTDSDVRLSRRGIAVSITQSIPVVPVQQWVDLIFPVVLRDMTRGRDLEQILSQYTTFVKPAFEEFCLPVSMMIISEYVPVFLCLSPYFMQTLSKISSRLRNMQMSSFPEELTTWVMIFLTRLKLISPAS